MKECPTCRHLYDVNWRFCRFDGSPLVNETVRPDEAVTITFPTGTLRKGSPLLEVRRRRGEREK